MISYILLDGKDANKHGVYCHLYRNTLKTIKKGNI